MTVARRLGRYALRERIGRGGFSEVFLAETEGAGGFRKRVVIKRLRPALDDATDMHDKLAAEARLVTRLGHGNVVQVLDFGIDGEAPYLVMELIDGCSLAELLSDLEQRGEKLGLEEALFVVESVCAALHHAHTARDEDGLALQIVHRDVKPGNVLLSRDGVVKLSDFGIAWARADAVFDADVGLGTEGYAAPEQLRGETVGPTADVYAVGILLGKLVAPYVAANEPGANELWDLVDAASREAAGDRLESADRLAGALEAWRGQHGIRHRPGALPDLVGRVADGRSHARLELPEDLEMDAPETRVLEGPPTPAPSRSPVPIIAIGLALLLVGGLALVNVLGLGEASKRADASRAGAPRPAGEVTHPSGTDAGEQPPAAPEAPPIETPLPPDPVPEPPTTPLEAEVVEASTTTKPPRQSRGRLRVNLLPWARVEVDGKSVGRTPVDVKLRPGKHRVTLSNPDTGQSSKLTVEIEARETTSITKW